MGEGRGVWMGQEGGRRRSADSRIPGRQRRLQEGAEPRERAAGSGLWAGLDGAWSPDWRAGQASEEGGLHATWPIWLHVAVTSVVVTRREVQPVTLPPTWPLSTAGHWPSRL